MDLTPVHPGESADASQHPSHPVIAKDTFQHAQMPSDLSVAPIEAPGDDSNDFGLLTAEQLILAKRARVIKGLPNEILDNIFARLDTAAPSDSGLYDEPIFAIPSSEITDLKSSSTVCWR